MSTAGLVPVDDEFVRGEQDALGCVLGAYLEGVIQAIPEEPLLMPGLDLPDNDVSLVVAPHDFGDGEALSDRVQKVGLDVLKALDAVDLLFDEVGDLLVQRFVAEGITSKSRPVTAFLRVWS